MALPNPVDTGPEPNPGRVLKLLIEASDASYGEIADHMGWSRSSLSERISGKTRLQVAEISRLAKLFGIEPGAFYADPMGFFRGRASGYIPNDPASASPRKRDRLSAVPGQGRSPKRNARPLVLGVP